MGSKVLGRHGAQDAKPPTDQPYGGAVSSADFADDEAYAFLARIPGTYTYYGAGHQKGRGEGNIWFGFSMRIEVSHYREMYHTPTSREALQRLGACVERVRALQHPIHLPGISVNLGYTPPGTEIRGLDDEPQLLTPGWWWTFWVSGVGFGAADNALDSEELAWAAVASAAERIVERLERTSGSSK